MKLREPKRLRPPNPSSFALSYTRSYLIPIILAAGFLAAAWGIAHFQIETDITRFIPEGGNRTRIRLSRLLNRTKSTGTLVLHITYSGIDRDKALAFSDRFTHLLKTSPDFTYISNGIQAPASTEILFDIYFPKRYLLAASDTKKLVSTLSPKGLDQAARTLKRTLYSPAGSAVKHIADRDPLLLFPQRMKHIRSMLRNIQPALYKNRYVTTTPPGFLVFAKTSASPFDVPAQKRIREEIYRKFSRLNAAADGSFYLNDTGFARFAIDAERLIRRDINLAFILSGTGMIFLFLVFFRRLTYMLHIFTPVVLGIFFAAGISSLVYGTIHGLTLAFGATLIGICIDYPVHLLNHIRYRRDQSEHPLPPWLFRSLFMSYLTTVLGFSVLFFSAFPGIRQMAFFALSGITYAFFFTMTISVRKLSTACRAPETAPGFGRISRLLAAFMHHRSKVLVLGLLIPAAAGFIIPEVHLFTDIRSLNSTDPETEAADRVISRGLPQKRYPLMVLVTGETEEAALQHNDALYLDLMRLRNASVLTSFFSIHPMLFSRQLQETNRRIFLEYPGFAEDMLSALRRAGFNPDAFSDFFNPETLSTIRPLTLTRLADTPLFFVLKEFIFQEAGQWIILNLLQPAPDTAFDKAALLPDNTHRLIIDSSSTLNEVITSSQKEMLILFGIGSLLIALFLIAYEKGIIPGLAAFSPALLSVVITPAVLWCAGDTINVMHVVSFLLILCMGADYGIFMTDTLRACRSLRDVAPSVLSVMISMLTTAFTFGVLVTAGNQALQAIGSTVVIGLPLAGAFAFFLVPVLPSVWRSNDD